MDHDAYVIPEVYDKARALSFGEKSALRGDSFLARLSDNEFRAGMDALQARGDGIDVSAPVTEEIDWFVFARHGRRGEQNREPLQDIHIFCSSALGSTTRRSDRRQRVRLEVLEPGPAGPLVIRDHAGELE